MARRFMPGGIGLCGLLLGGIALAAVPPLSPEELEAQSTYIILGQVEAVYERTVESEPGNSNREVVAEIRVHCTQKGEGIEAGELAFVHAWEPAARPEGWAGHQGGPVPVPGAYVRVYVQQDEHGRLQILSPNGQDEIRPQIGPDGTANLCSGE